MGFKVHKVFKIWDLMLFRLTFKVTWTYFEKFRAPGCQREYESRAAVNTVVLHPNQVIYHITPFFAVSYYFTSKLISPTWVVEICSLSQ